MGLARETHLLIVRLDAGLLEVIEGDQVQHTIAVDILEHDGRCEVLGRHGALWTKPQRHVIHRRDVKRVTAEQGHSNNVGGLEGFRIAPQHERDCNRHGAQSSALLGNLAPTAKACWIEGERGNTCAADEAPHLPRGNPGILKALGRVGGRTPGIVTVAIPFLALSQGLVTVEVIAQHGDTVRGHMLGMCVHPTFACRPLAVLFVMTVLGHDVFRRSGDHL